MNSAHAHSSLSLRVQSRREPAGAGTGPFIWITAAGLSACANVVAEALHRLRARRACDDGVGVLGGERTAARRSAGLDIDRATFNHGSGVQRTTRLVVASRKVDGADLRRIGIGLGPSIEHDGVVIPGLK